MAFEAIYKYGDQGMINHTPSGNIAAGEVVALANRYGIAVKAITATELGSLATEGVFDVAKGVTTGTAFTESEQVYFNESTNKAVNAKSTAAPTLMGFAVGTAADSATTVCVQLKAQVATLA